MSSHIMEYCAGLVKAYLTCDQRCAFSENTTVLRFLPWRDGIWLVMKRHE